VDLHYTRSLATSPRSARHGLRATEIAKALRGRPNERLPDVGSWPLMDGPLSAAQRAHNGRTVPGTFNRLNPEISLSCLLAPHPLQIRAGRNQLEPLLVTMTDGELLHVWRLGSTCRAASHAIRTWRGALLYLQIRELSGEASVCAVLLPKPLNLFLTFLPVHPCCPWWLGDSET
jgi:hypothetical protein